MSKLAMYAVIVSFSITMGVARESTAQMKALSEVALQVAVGRSDLLDFISEVESKSEFSFVYAKRELKGKSVSLSKSQWEMAELLREVSGQSRLSFHRVNGAITIKKVVSPTERPIVTETIIDQITVSGTIFDESGVPLPGANVLVKGTSNGTITDISGKYQLTVPEEAVLVVSFVGYKTIETPVAGRITLDFNMQPDYASLEEIVVVGYGEQKKADLTGAVSVVESADLQKRQATTVAEAMQGLATGVNIRGGGLPGSEAQIQIRGLGNFSDTPPLYVIDGMITTANRDFNPNDIESIQILKDASAAAIYGSRAANGVIIITTKKGTEGPLKVAFSAKSGMQIMPRYDLADRDEYIRLNDMAYDNAGAERQDHDLTNNTDWQDETYQTGRIQDYNLSLSGGSQNGTYMISGNYFENKGTVISTGFERLSFRVNTQAKKGIFSIGENIAISSAKADEMSGNPIYDVTRLMPTIPLYDENNPGGYGYGNETRARTFGTNPIALADFDDRTNANLRIRGNVWSELQLLPLLKFRTNLGYETSSDHYKYLRKEGNWTLNQPYDPSRTDENRAQSSTVLVENTLTFSEEFGKHSIEVLLGQTYQSNKYSQIAGIKRNLPLNPTTGNYYTTLDNGDQAVVTGFETASTLLSYLGRLNYIYNGKYIVNAVFRRDGTSRLSPDNRWKTFPSVGGAWRISDEDFFDVDLVSNLKLRANYGTLGSSNIGSWDYQQKINTFSTIAIGDDQHIEAGATNVQLANNNLRWETLKQTNFGLDFGLFENKLSGSAEYYISETADVLTGAPITFTTGNDGGNPVVNAASLRNSGFEFALTFTEAERLIKYSATLNITTIKNEVLDLGYDRSDFYIGNTVTSIGQPIGMWYLLETDGIFQSEEEVLNHTTDGTVIQPGAQPGDIRFVDHNQDGQITNDDKQVLGDPWSDLEIGLNSSVSYENFELTMTWFSALGGTVYSGARSLMGRFDDNSNYLSGIQPWTPENPNTNTPRAFYGTTLNSRGDTDRWLEDGSFLRLKFVSLAYHIPESVMEKIGFATGTVSVSAQNLLTFTKYSGLDPEFRGPTIYERGFDHGAFPNLRTVFLGLNFGF